MSLAELLITVFLATLVLSLVTTLVLQVRGTAVTEVARTTDLGQSVPALDQVNRVLRATQDPSSAAPGVETAESSRVRVYSLYGAQLGAAGAAGAVRQVDLALDAASGDLTMTVTDPAPASLPTWVPGTSTTRVLARGLTNTETTPLFAYLKADGAALSSAERSTPAGRAQVASVRVDLLLGTGSGTAQPVRTQETVRLANYYFSS